MEPDLAAEAIESMQAAPVAGAENEKEREKSALLERMEGTGEPGAGEGEGEAEAPKPAPEEEAAELGEDPAEEARRKSREALAKDFPDALADGSELAAACREELEYLRAAGSPLADDPEAEYKIARRLSRLMSLGPKPALPPEPPVKTAPPRRSIRPLPTGGAPVESPATVLERRVAGAKSTGDMLSLLREIGTPFEALLKR